MSIYWDSDDAVLTDPWGTEWLVVGNDPHASRFFDDDLEAIEQTNWDAFTEDLDVDTYGCGSWSMYPTRGTVTDYSGRRRESFGCWRDCIDAELIRYPDDDDYDWRTSSLPPDDEDEREHWDAWGDDPFDGYDIIDLGDMVPSWAKAGNSQHDWSHHSGVHLSSARLIRKGSDAEDTWRDITRALSNYPLLDDDAYSEREHDAWMEWCGNGLGSDVGRELWDLYGDDLIEAFGGHDDPDAEDRAEQLIDALSSEQVLARESSRLHYYYGFTGEYGPEFGPLLRDALKEWALAVRDLTEPRLL